MASLENVALLNISGLIRPQMLKVWQFSVGAGGGDAFADSVAGEGETGPIFRKKEQGGVNIAFYGITDIFSHNKPGHLMRLLGSGFKTGKKKCGRNSLQRDGYQVNQTHATG